MNNYNVKFAMIAALVLVFTSTQAQLTSSFTVAGTNGFCRNQNVSFVNASTNAISYTWDFGDGLTSTLTNPTHAFSYSGTYLVTLTSTDGNQTKVSRKPIYVRDLPYSSFNLSSAGFGNEFKAGEVIKPLNYSTSAVTYYWNNGNGIIGNQEKFSCTYSQPGQYTMTLITTNGCGDSGTYASMLTIIDTNNYTPIASGMVSPQMLCPGTSVYCYAYTETYTSLVWDMGDGGVVTDKESFDYIYKNKGNYIVKLIARYKNKADTTSFNVIVTDTALDRYAIYTGIQPQYYDPNTSTMRYMTCPGSPFTFNGSSSDQIAKHYWKLPGNIVLQTQDTTWSFASIGDYPLTYVVENKCGVRDSFQYLLSVRVKDSIPANAPYVQITAGPNGAICPGATAYMTAYTGDATFTKWIFHDGQVVLNASEAWKKYPVAGTFDIKFVYGQGCRTDTVTRTVTVAANAESYAGFNFLGTSNPTVNSNCTGDSIYMYTDTSFSTIMKTVNITSHKWTMGDGTIYTTPLVRHKYAAPGYYSILHEATNSCGQTAYNTSTVWVSSNTSPVANFYLPQQISCVNDSVMIDQFSQKADSIVIHMGDGNRKIITKDNFFPHLWYVYKTPGMYTVKLVAYNHCNADSAYDNIHILALPTASILMQDTTIKPGTNLSIHANMNGSVRHLWRFGPNPSDTSSAQVLNRTFGSNGVFKIYLTTVNANDCDNTDSVTVTVNNQGAIHEMNNELDALLYPNPTTGELNIRLNHPVVGTLRLDIIDIKGATLWTHDYKLSDQLPATLSLDLTALKAGVYMVRLTHDTGISTYRLIKQ